MNIPIYIQQDAMLHSVFYLETALHVSGGTITHHRERKQLYLQHLVLVRPLLLPAAIAVWQIADAVDTVVCAPDDGWWYHTKYVEQFPDINKLCNIASCWIYIRILLRCTDPWTLNVCMKFNVNPQLSVTLKHVRWHTLLVLPIA
jgi:hypothetical protein